MKFKVSGFYEPTPAKMRKIGDVLQYGSQIFAGTQIVNGDPKLGLVVMVIGAIGKVLSNFFVEEKWIKIKFMETF